MEGQWHPQACDLLPQDVALGGIEIAAVHRHRQQHDGHMPLLLDGASGLRGGQFWIVQRHDRRRPQAPGIGATVVGQPIVEGGAIGGGILGLERIDRHHHMGEGAVDDGDIDTLGVHGLQG